MIANRIKIINFIFKLKTSTMKKLYLFISCSLIAVSLDAQYSMTNFHNVAPGDTYNSYNAADTLAQEGPAGASQTWNFATLNINPTMVTETYVAPGTTPAGASYPNATAASGSGSTYAYVKCNTTTFAVEGASNPATTVSFTDDQVIFTYPFTYLSTLTDNFSGNVTGSAAGTATGVTMSTGDGHGTLVMPGGTFNNVLRVKSTYTRTDNLGLFNIDYYSESYIWYSAITKDALLNINRLATTFFGNTTWTKSIRISSIAAVGINENNDVLSDVKIFPNPSSEIVFLQVKPELVKSSTRLEIVDMLGNVVFSQNADQLNAVADGICSINVTSFAKGSYFVRVSTPENNSVQKLIIQ